MRMVALLDTSISSNNLGDEIIMDAVRAELRACIPDAYFVTIVTHDYCGRIARKLLRQCEFGILGGTNAMSSAMLRGPNWRITPFDLGAMRNIVLMGVGWQDYHPKASLYARFLYKRVLSDRYAHSFRDGYTHAKAAQLNKKALNTACPTMWQLTPEHCATIPTRKANHAVTALTYYRPDPVHDRTMLDLLFAHYGKVYFWCQQAQDWEYLQSLGHYDVELIDPNVHAYTQLLQEEDVDFIGSRLHGGIRALQNGRRALITIVDNRAAEIGRDTNCMTLPRDDHTAIARWIAGSDPVRITLPTEAIEMWRGQFARA